jgi:hypothetical protein
LEDRKKNDCSHGGTVGKTCGCDQQCNANVSRGGSEADRLTHPDRVACEYPASGRTKQYHDTDPHETHQSDFRECPVLEANDSCKDHEATDRAEQSLKLFRVLQKPGANQQPDSQRGIWVLRRVVTILNISILKLAPRAIRGKRKLNRIGARIAEDAAKITVTPTETWTSPLDIAVSGGANGAAGHTATRTNPADTIGSVWNRYKRSMAAVGTRT